MIVDTSTNVETNITESKEFTISSDSARLFRMLSDFLYSDKEKCVLHEISANAVDAHKLVGKQDVPICVTAPTKLEPKARIRDYGPGLCEDDVYRLLTTYGESGAHKRDSNEYFGAWGIGSKSVAAVSNTWQITSWFQGKGKEYVIFINEKSIPSLTKIREFDCGEETGLEVTIPVPPEKHYEWRDNFSSVYQYYDVRPVFTNHPPTFNDGEKIFESKSFYVENRHGQNHYSSSPKFILSYRAYPTNGSKLENLLTKAEYQFMVMPGVFFKFQTGELELSISRETLQYTQYTIEAITQKMKSSFVEMRKVITDATSGANNSLEYRSLFIKEYSTMFGELKINKCGSSYDPLIDALLEGNEYGVTRRQLRTFVIKKPVTPTTYRIYNGRNIRTINDDFTAWKTFAVSQEDGELYIKLDYLANNKIDIVVTDCRNAMARIRHEYRDERIKYILIVDESVDMPKELDFWTIKASALAIPPTRPREKKEAVVSDIWRIRANSFTRYVPASYDDCAYVTFSKSKSLESITDATKYFNNKQLLEDLGITVYGVKLGMIVPKGLKTIDQALSGIMKECSVKKLEEMWEHNCGEYLRSLNDLVNHGTKMESEGLIIPEGSALNKLMVLRKKTSGTYISSSVIKKYLDLCKALDKVPHDFSKIQSLGGLVEDCLARYPLLEYIERYRTPTEQIFNYINICEGITS